MGFFPRNIWELSLISAQFSDRFVKVVLTHYTKNMNLYFSALKQSSALFFAPGIYLSEYYLRC